MRIWAGLFLLGLAFAQAGEGPALEAAFARCQEVVRRLRPLGLYEVRGRAVLVLGLPDLPLLPLALVRGRPLPLGHPGEGVFPETPPSWLEELALARLVVREKRGYACFLVHRGVVVGVLRLGLDLKPRPFVPKGQVRQRFEMNTPPEDQEGRNRPGF